MNQLRRVAPLTYSQNSAYLHLIIEMIWRGRAFFKGKLYDIDTLILHLPLPLKPALLQSMSTLGVETTPFQAHIKAKMYGMLIVPAYENRIIISHPEYAIYDNEPLVVIELENENNYPTYYEIN